jgi:hypothetical protein
VFIPLTFNQQQILYSKLLNRQYQKIKKI